MPVKTLRIIFGVYLVQHFVSLLPWGAELFSNRGVLPDASASPLIHAFPNVLAVWDSPLSVTILLLTAAAASVAFLVGWRDRPAALVIWYFLACLFGRNPLILNPAMPFLGWLLLAHAVALPRRDFLRVAWILMAVAYAYSGWTKLVSPSWINGTAVEMILRNPLARPGIFRDLLLALPVGISRVLTWSVLGLELSFAPLAALRRARPWIWMAMLGLHIGLIATIQFADLSLGMVILHLFTLDPLWMPACPKVTNRLSYSGLRPTALLPHHHQGGATDEQQEMQASGVYVLCDGRQRILQ